LESKSVNTDLILYIASLIHRVREKETLSEQEQLDLDNWRASDDCNARLYEELQDRSRLVAEVKELVNTDYTTATQELFEKIGISRPATPVYRRWRMATAAAVLLLFAGTYLWRMNRSSQQVAEGKAPATHIDVAPGKQGAILTLADGRNVVLDSMGNGVIATQNGSKVLLKNGQLAYHRDGTATTEAAFNTVTTPKGRQFQVALPDGTKVWLNAASSLRYPTLFSGKERKVEITGEAYFEVAANPAMPFRVQVNKSTDIEVLGTRFNINSYTDEANVNATLLEGSVQVVRDGEKALLYPGQQAQVSGQIKIVNNVNVEKVVAWKNGVFDFQDANLEEVMRQLERWYDIEVIYKKGIPKLEFIGKMGRDLSLSAVLNGLQMSRVHFRLEEGRRLIVLP
jgi:ferric-dicitrate binding protein FerR (iron transport regulator)